MSDDACSLLRMTSDKGDVLWVGVHPDPVTGKPTPLAEVTDGSLDMLMAMQDGVLVIAKPDGYPLVALAPLDWIEKNHSKEATSGLYMIRQALYAEGMLS
jgi:hypothetical protein